MGEDGYRVERGNEPDPGQYDGHIKPFGSSPNKMTIGGKYKHNYDANPGPGLYEPEGALS
jgi:hypothetical protein